MGTPVVVYEDPGWQRLLPLVYIRVLHGSDRGQQVLAVASLQMLWETLLALHRSLGCERAARDERKKAISSTQVTKL